MNKNKPWGLSGNVRILPVSDLKKIEEEHGGEGGHGDGCFDGNGVPHDPCDVVKLARALDEAIGMLEGLPETEEWKRTLKEVAGE